MKINTDRFEPQIVVASINFMKLQSSRSINDIDRKFCLSSNEALDVSDAGLNSRMFLPCLICLIASTVGQYNPATARNEFLQPFLDPLEGSGRADEDELDGLRNTIPGEPGTAQPPTISNYKGAELVADESGRTLCSQVP